MHQPSISEMEEEQPRDEGDTEPKVDQPGINSNEPVADILFLDDENRRRSLQFDPSPQIQQEGRKVAEEVLLAQDRRACDRQKTGERAKETSIPEMPEERDGEWLTASIEPVCAYRVIHNATAAVVGDYGMPYTYYIIFKDCFSS